MATLQTSKQDLIKAYGKNAKDSGSAEAQVAIFSERITHLTAHLKGLPKDFATRRGLLALVGKRRRLLNYLKENRTPEAYKALLTQLNLRK